MDQWISTIINTIFLESRLQLSLLGSDSDCEVNFLYFETPYTFKLVIAIFGKLSNPVTEVSKQNIGKLEHWISHKTYRCLKCFFL